MNDEIQLEDLKLSMIALWRNRFLVICITIFTSLCGWLLTFDDKPDNAYQAQTSIYSVAYGTGNDVKYLSDALISYADIVTSNRVCESAVSLLKGNTTLDVTDIQNMIGVTAVNDSVIKIYAVSNKPELSIEVTNAVAEAFVREVTAITNNNSVQILDAADSFVVSDDGEKNIIMKRLIFGMVGFLGSSVYIMGAELMSDTVRSVEQCIGKDEREILGIVPYIK